MLEASVVMRRTKCWKTTQSFVVRIVEELERDSETQSAGRSELPFAVRSVSEVTPDVVLDVKMRGALQKCVNVEEEVVTSRRTSFSSP